MSEDTDEWMCLYCGTHHADKQEAREHAEHSMQGVVKKSEVGL